MQKKFPKKSRASLSVKLALMLRTTPLPKYISRSLMQYKIHLIKPL